MFQTGERKPDQGHNTDPRPGDPAAGAAGRGTGPGGVDQREQVETALQRLADGLPASPRLLTETLLPPSPLVVPRIPETILEASADLVRRGERLDMRSLAERLSISRTSLYRKVRDRDALLGEACWRLMRAHAGNAIGLTQSLSGGDRLASAAAFMLDEMGRERWLQTLLERELRGTLRVMLDPHGAPWQGLERIFVTLLEAELQQRPGPASAPVFRELALPIVRIYASCLFPDVASGREADAQTADLAIRATLNDRAPHEPKPRGDITRVREPVRVLTRG